MDQTRFDAVTRILASIPSRRDVLRGLAGAGLGFAALRLPDAVEAKTKKKNGKKRKDKNQNQNPPAPPGCTPNCADRACGNDGCGGSCGVCGADQVCQGGTCCAPEPRSATCGGRCGTWTNNCGKPVACATCPAGQQCLDNGGCAIVCDEQADCSGLPSFCGGCSNPSVEGAHHCISNPTNVRCTSTADCAPGAHCQDLGAGGLCIQLCT